MTELGKKEFTLSVLRAVSVRLKEIDAVVCAYGVARNHDLISDKRARELVEQVAPGLIDAVALDIFDEGGK